MPFNLQLITQGKCVCVYAHTGICRKRQRVGWEMAGQVKYLPCEFEEQSSGFQNAHKTQVGRITGSLPVIPRLTLQTGDP